MPDKVKTKLDKSGDVKAFSQTAIVNNNGVIEYCRKEFDAFMGWAVLNRLQGLYILHITSQVLWVGIHIINTHP